MIRLPLLHRLFARAEAEPSSADAPDSPCSAPAQPAPPSTPPPPFGLERRARPDDTAAHRKALAEAGIRALPAPFSGALAIFSDNDGSTAEDFRRVRDLIVRRFGLDFGDSVRVMHSFAHHGATAPPGSSPPPFPPELSILNSETGTSAPPSAIPDDTLGTQAGIAAVLRGDIDHLHGFSNFGPCAVPLRLDRSGDGSLRISLPDGDGDDADIARALALHAILLPGSVEVLAHATLITHDGIEHTLAPPRPGSPSTPTGLGPGLDGFLLQLSSADGAPVPIGEVSALRLPPGHAGPIPSHALALSLTGPRLLDGLRALRTEGVRFRLFTDCSARSFLARSPELRWTSDSERLLLEGRPVALGVGARRTPEGVPPFTALADDPRSFCAIAGPLISEFGLRYVNPSGLSGEKTDALAVHETLCDTTDRSGRPALIARRALVWLEHELDANASNPAMGPTDNGTATFAPRLSRALDTLAARRDEHDLVIPLYTHLGNHQPKDDRPDPYLDLAPLSELQSAVLGLPGARSRAWFLRASSLCAYADVLDSLPVNLSRSGPDDIKIEPWTHKITGDPFPSSPHELDGVTVFVEDQHRAAVSLGQIEIPELVRRSAEPGESPTVRAVGIRYRTVLLGDLPPPGAEGKMIDHDPDGAPQSAQTPPMRRYLRAHAGEILHWCPPEIPAYGAQFVHVLWRATDPEARLTVSMESPGGDTWAFSNEDHEATGQHVLATARLSSPGRDAWVWDMIPLWDLAWTGAARPGVELPSQGVRMISLRVSGPRDARVDVDRIELIRPGSDPVPEIGGLRVAGDGAAPGSLVTLTARQPGATPGSQEATADSGGWWVFRGVPRGSVVTAVGTDRHGSPASTGSGSPLEAWDHLPDLRLRPDRERA